MGSSQSIPTTSEITDAPRFYAESNEQHEEYFASSKNGPKTQPNETNLISLTEDTVEEEDISSVVSTTTTESDVIDDDDDDYDSSDEEDDELDEFIAERKRILNDASSLKKLAIDYLQSEKAVVVTEPNVFGRNFFVRGSAPTQYDDDDNFLTTISRVREGQVDRDMEDERERILAEAAELKVVAEWYHDPNKPIVTTDAFACGRNFYSRLSASEYKDDEDDDDDDIERECVLNEAAELKEAAKRHLHPEKKIASGPRMILCGRNYFTRPSAFAYEDDEDGYFDESERVVSEAVELKKVADWHLHPEKEIEVDPATFGRNYFASTAPEDSDEDIDEEERELVLSETASLKQVADWHLHPEKEIKVDPASFGRNYFSSPAVDDDEEDLDKERELVLSEMASLKQVADWHLHPEKTVEVDPASFGRNYFSSTAEDEELDKERKRVLSEIDSLKQVADWHLRPEKKIEIDPASFGRNYFSSPASDEDDEDLDEERELVLSEIASLKQVAKWYLHPEKKIEVDPVSFGRNYFSSSADEDEDLDEERGQVLSEIASLKQVADWHLHPEKKIEVDPASFGRNYFASNASDEDEDRDEERELVLSEIASLKQVAKWHLHPEKKIEVDPASFGRNYFPSVPEEDEDLDEELEHVLSDMASLKQVADWYLHPEKQIEVDPASFGRNYFSSTAEEDDEDLDEERELVLSEMASLKQVAKWHLHPEKKIEVDPASFGRNYFSSVPEEDDDQDLDEERELVLSEMASLKQVADWHLHPEKKIEVDPASFGRNYFSSIAAEDDDQDLDEERELVLSEMASLKQVADWHLHPEKKIEVDPASFGRNYLSLSAPEDLEERECVLFDASELKKLAIDYLHPEKPVTPSSVNCARNYFDRPSAKVNHADYIHTQGYANHHVHMEEDYVMHHDDYHHYDYHHQDDVSHGSFTSHGDHFDMDEDFQGFRESITAFRDSVTAIHDQHIPIIKEEGDGKEGNLSRSPSTVMLFEESAF